jgi:hypothetical protein
VILGGGLKYVNPAVLGKGGCWNSPILPTGTLGARWGIRPVDLYAFIFAWNACNNYDKY